MSFPLRRSILFFRSFFFPEQYRSTAVLDIKPLACDVFRLPVRFRSVRDPVDPALIYFLPSSVHLDAVPAPFAHVSVVCASRPFIHRGYFYHFFLLSSGFPWWAGFRTQRSGGSPPETPWSPCNPAIRSENSPGICTDLALACTILPPFRCRRPRQQGIYHDTQLSDGQFAPKISLNLISG